MPADTLRALVGRRLERGVDGGWAGRLAAAAWEAWSGRTVARPLRVPAGVRVVGVGGAVLGGAGKTPVAIALTRALAGLGEAPALVGHGYRARPGRPRVVGPADPLAEVGDDAITAARLLGGAAPVVVGPTRQAAVDHAAGLGRRVLVADGLLQARPARISASILVLDPRSPWGSGACPPIGDLRAPREALLAAADLVAALVPEGVDPRGLPPGTLLVPSRLAGAVSAGGEAVPLDDLRRRRLGLVLAVARPDRIVEALARAGLHPEARVILGDHAIPDPAALARSDRVETWITTARCSTKIPPSIAGRPVLALDHRVEVGGLARALAGCGVTGSPC